MEQCTCISLPWLHILKLPGEFLLIASLQWTLQLHWTGSEKKMQYIMIIQTRVPKIFTYIFRPSRGHPLHQCLNPLLLLLLLLVHALFFPTPSQGTGNTLALSILWVRLSKYMYMYITEGMKEKERSWLMRVVNYQEYFIPFQVWSGLYHNAYSHSEKKKLKEQLRICQWRYM